MSVLPKAVESLYDIYDNAMDNGDPFTRGWLLSGNFAPVLGLIISYLAVVYSGPKLMVNIKAVQLQNTLVLYNLFMVILNAYFIYECVTIYVEKDYSWHCQYSFNTATDHYRLARAIWLYYMSKVVELMDSVFFIVRKKNDQLSFLHIYHHSSMIAYMYMITKWFPTGIGVTIVTLNSLIHVIMYTYYALAAMGPAVQKYLWWKKYLTMVQLAQFVLFLWFGVNGLRLGGSCQYPAWLKMSVVLYMMSFLVLFSQFYIYAYWKGKRSNNRKERSTLGPINMCTSNTLAPDSLKDGSEHTNGFEHTNGIEHTKLLSDGQTRNRKRSTAL